MQVYYKTDIVEKIDDALDQAMADGIEIDYIQVSKLEWEILKTRIRTLGSTEVWKDMLNQENFINPVIKLRGVTIMRDC